MKAEKSPVDTVLSICASLGANAWTSADKALVEVRLPKIVSNIAGAIGRATNTTQSDVESEIVWLLILHGLTVLAVKFSRDLDSIEEAINSTCENL